MRIGLILSFVLHGGLLAWAVLSLPQAKALKTPVIKHIPVDIVNLSEKTNIKAGDKKAPEEKAVKPPEKKITEAPKKKKKKKAQPKHQAEIVKSEPPEPVKPLEVKKAEKKPKPSPKKTIKKAKKPNKQQAKPKPKNKLAKRVKRKSKKKFDEDKIAALLNKIPDKAGGPTPLPDLPGAKKKVQKTKGHFRGRAQIMSISDIDAFRRQVSNCWNPPVGGLGAEDLLVKVRLQLREDGTLKGPPKIINRSSSPFFQAAADSAARAIWQCQPYQLPPGKYETWRDMVLNFDPRHMLGG